MFKKTKDEDGLNLSTNKIAIDGRYDEKWCKILNLMTEYKK
jgi:hypothetical protein